MKIKPNLSTCRIEVSYYGQIADMIIFDSLKKLPLIRDRSVGRYSLPVLDSHGSHLIPEFDGICAANEVISIHMPAYSSRLFQPLYIGCFSTPKRVYSKIIEKQKHCSRNIVDKLDFLEVYPKAHQHALS